MISLLCDDVIADATIVFDMESVKKSKWKKIFDRVKKMNDVWLDHEFTTVFRDPEIARSEITASWKDEWPLPVLVETRDLVDELVGKDGGKRVHDYEQGLEINSLKPPPFLEVDPWRVCDVVGIWLD